MFVELIKMKTSSNALSVIDLETTFAHIIRIIDSTSRNEYTFLKQCERFFDYRQPKEIILNVADEPAYYVLMNYFSFFYSRLISISRSLMS
jgi:hypothetical protein